MLTRSLAENLTRRFPKECKIKGDYLRYLDKYLISIDILPVTALLIDDMSIIYNSYHLEVILDIIGDDSESINYLKEDSRIHYGESPTMCWEWNGKLYPIEGIFIISSIDLKRAKKLHLVEEMKERNFNYFPGEFVMDFQAVYKYFTGQDYISGKVELVPSFDHDKYCCPLIDDTYKYSLEDEDKFLKEYDTD